MGGREVQPGWSGQWVVLSLGRGRVTGGSGVPARCAGEQGGGGVLLVSKCHQSPGTGKAGFPLTVISRGDRLLEG